MRRDEALKLAKTLQLSRIQTKHEWVLAACPFASWKHRNGQDNHPSFGIHAKKEFYNCFSCGMGGTVTSLLDELRLLVQQDKDIEAGKVLAKAYEYLDRVEEGRELPEIPEWSPYGNVVLSTDPIVEWPEWMLDSLPSVRTSKEAMAYLHGRGLGEAAVIDYFDLRHDPFKDAVVVPLWDRKKRFVGLRGRYLDPVDDIRYHNYVFNHQSNTAHFWFNEDRVDYGLPVVLVEGMFDLMAVWRIYPNVLSPFSTQMSVSKLRKLTEFPEVYCLFDNDVAGQAATEKVIEVLSSQIPVRSITYPSNLKFKDPAEMPQSVLSSILIDNRLFLRREL